MLLNSFDVLNKNSGHILHRMALNKSSNVTAEKWSIFSATCLKKLSLLTLTFACWFIVHTFKWVCFCVSRLIDHPSVMVVFFFVSCICFLLEVTTLLLVYFWYVCVWGFFFCLCELVITAVWVSHLLKCVWDGHAIAAWDLLQIFLCDVPSVLRVTQLQRCQHGTELDNLFSSKCSTLIYKCIHSAHTYSKHTYPHTQTLN